MCQRERQRETGVLRMKIKWCFTGDSDVNQTAKQLCLKGRSYQEQGNTINGCNCFFVVVVCRNVFDSNKAVIWLLMYSTLLQTHCREDNDKWLFLSAGYLMPLPLPNNHFFITCDCLHVWYWFCHTTVVMHNILCHKECSMSVRWQALLCVGAFCLYCYQMVKLMC